ncbi:hypothetical protein TrRE_jg11898 [Triparma retinervis]|uniref:Uncharacterized protein n=1 Tax=Triparma retinervis TaxID=2557542 RepID=A0A9W6ZBK1_9STRA|nr:hypothetical protein TrRE_jg11898 [Triparma retinervis]
MESNVPWNAAELLALKQGLPGASVFLAGTNLDTVLDTALAAEDVVKSVDLFQSAASIPTAPVGFANSNIDVTVSKSFDFGSLDDLGTLDASADAVGMGELGDLAEYSERIEDGEAASLKEGELLTRAHFSAMKDESLTDAPLPAPTLEPSATPLSPPSPRDPTPDPPRRSIISEGAVSPSQTRSKMPLAKAIFSPEAAAFNLAEEERPSSAPPSPGLRIEINDDQLASNDSLLVSATLTNASDSVSASRKLRYDYDSLGNVVSVSSPAGIALLEAADESIAVEESKVQGFTEVSTSTSLLCIATQTDPTPEPTAASSTSTTRTKASTEHLSDQASASTLLSAIERPAFVETLKEQIQALEELLAAAENREMPESGALPLLKKWRSTTFASIMTKNSALRRAEGAEKAIAAAVGRLREVEGACDSKLRLMSAKVSESKNLVEAESAKRLQAQEIAASCEIKSQEHRRVAAGIVDWVTNFTGGNPSSRSVPRNTLEQNYERRGNYIIENISKHKGISPAQARENALCAGSDLLERYEKRLNKVAHKVQTLGVHLAAKDAHLRNEQAAFVAEKAAWKKMHKNLGATKLRPSLSSEAEAIMRGIFKKLEGRNGVGKVEVRRLTSLLMTDRNLAFAMDYAVGSESWFALLKALEETLSRDNKNATVTWGEFLLCFIDGGAAELSKYKQFNIPSPSEIAIKSGEEVYTHSLLDTANKPHGRFEVAHLELVLPLSGRKMEEESFLRSLERMGDAELREVVRRLTRERTWCMDILHRLCVQGPRAQAMETASRRFSQNIEELMRLVEVGEEQHRLQEVEISRLKSDLSKEREGSERRNIELQSLNKRIVGEAGLRSKLEVTERRCEMYKVRLDQGEEELGESKRKESIARKDGAKLAARTQAALREAARGEKRLITFMGECKRREKDLIERAENAETLNTELRERLSQVENDYRLYEARVGGVWEGMGIAERAPISPARSTRSTNSWQHNTSAGGSVRSSHADRRMRIEKKSHRC